MTSFPTMNQYDEGAIRLQNEKYQEAIKALGIPHGPRTDAEVLAVLSEASSSELTDIVEANFMIIYHAFKSMSSQR